MQNSLTRVLLNKTSFTQRQQLEAKIPPDPVLIASACDINILLLMTILSDYCLGGHLPSLGGGGILLTTFGLSASLLSGRGVGPPNSIQCSRFRK